MEALDKKQLSDAFVEVRKAYRLLYHFQKRVLDLIRFISDFYSTPYKGGHPRFSAPSPRHKKGKLSLWAWDWLNMYLYEFHLGKTIINNKEIALSIVLQSDSGFFDMNLERSSKIDIDSFNSAESSKTQLIFVAGYLDWNDDIFKYPNKYLTEENTYVKKNDGKIICVKAYDLSLFIDEENTKNQLKDFNKFCANEGIEIIST